MSCFFSMNLLSSCWTFSRLRSFNWVTSASHRDVSRAEEQQLTGKDMKTQVLSRMGVNGAPGSKWFSVSGNGTGNNAVLDLVWMKTGWIAFCRNYTSIKQLPEIIISVTAVSTCEENRHALLATVAPLISRQLCTAYTNCYTARSYTAC